jgi:hypothetical protein
VARPLRLRALVAHEPGPEGALGGVLIVAAAPEANVPRRRLAPARYRLDVIKFEQRARLATVASFADERALPPVALPHRALHGRRDMPGGGTGPRMTGAIGGGELALLELGRSQPEGALKHQGHLPRRNLVAHQRLDVLEQVLLELDPGLVRRGGGLALAVKPNRC